MKTLAKNDDPVELVTRLVLKRIKLSLSLEEILLRLFFSLKPYGVFGFTISILFLPSPIDSVITSLSSCKDK